MASLTPTICSKPAFHPLRNSHINVSLCNVVPGRYSAKSFIIQQEFSKSFRLCYSNQPMGRKNRNNLKPICAASSGLETSMRDSKGTALKFRKVEIVVESRDVDKITLRVDLSGEDTQKGFDIVLANLATSAPLLPGFRRQKGGKTSKVPKNLLIDILGKDRVMKFVLQEIVTSAVETFVKEGNISVKDNKITTTQTEDELNQSFIPGNEFGFNVELELVNEETGATDEQTGGIEKVETANA